MLHNVSTNSWTRRPQDGGFVQHQISKSIGPVYLVGCQAVETDSGVNLGDTLLNPRRQNLFLLPHGQSHIAAVSLPEGLPLDLLARALDRFVPESEVDVSALVPQNARTGEPSSAHSPDCPECHVF